MRDLENVLARQKAAYLAQPYPSHAERIADLKTLERFLRDQQEAVIAAINEDYGHRSRHETILTDIFPALDSIRHISRHLRGWMKTQRRGVDLKSFFGATNRVIPQPVGVIGIIVPWNFPIFLSLIPLATALAAGNRCMVKMSENSRHLAALLIEKMPHYFPPEKVAFFDETGGVGIAFSQLPFDHLLFTGSSQTGRAVMAAASANLCPVTLELGGKSPALVCGDFPLKVAAERIMATKLLNAGQICTTVDHVFVPNAAIEEFVGFARTIVRSRYDGLASPDFTAIIDRKSFDRLKAALEEAQQRGARLIPLLEGPAFDEESRKINPHLVLDAPDDCSLMTREIFGPILPVRGYKSIDEVVAIINQGPRPLGFYPFSHDNILVNRLLERVMSGGVSVNDAVYHAAQHDLPFGGIGNSGMGHYHGREGFETFSKMRPIFYQGRLTFLKWLAPPYGKFADLVLGFLLKF